jgi:hypothetical protein
MNRIFISYRSADGAKDASRLADDLGRVFGADRVFLDREDLRGGSSWREQIALTMDHRPVVLLLMTPGFFAARHENGDLRINDADDPVRGEILSAMEAGAAVLPLRVDGTPMPAAGSLPAALRDLSEIHALPLRTDEWSAVDLPRIIADIERLGVSRAPGTVPLAREVGAGVTRRNGRMLSLAIVLALVFAAVMLMRPHAPDPSRPVSLDGKWVLTLKGDRHASVHVRQRDDRLELRSDPVRVDDDPDWQPYIETLAGMNVPPLTHVRYTAEGELFGEEADLALTIFSADAGFKVNTGNLHLRVGPDGAGWTGEISLNSGEQQAVSLRRSR